jgi:hypothetical protein
LIEANVDSSASAPKMKMNQALVLATKYG